MIDAWCLMLDAWCLMLDAWCLMMMMMMMMMMITKLVTMTMTMTLTTTMTAENDNDGDDDHDNGEDNDTDNDDDADDGDGGGVGGGVRKITWCPWAAPGTLAKARRLQLADASFRDYLLKAVRFSSYVKITRGHGLFRLIKFAELGCRAIFGPSDAIPNLAMWTLNPVPIKQYTSSSPAWNPTIWSNIPILCTQNNLQKIELGKAHISIYTYIYIYVYIHIEFHPPAENVSSSLPFLPWSSKPRPFSSTSMHQTVKTNEEMPNSTPNTETT